MEANLNTFLITIFNGIIIFLLSLIAYFFKRQQENQEKDICDLQKKVEDHEKRIIKIEK